MKISKQTIGSLGFERLFVDTDHWRQSIVTTRSTSNERINTVTDNIVSLLFFPLLNFDRYVRRGMSLHLATVARANSNSSNERRRSGSSVRFGNSQFIVMPNSLQLVGENSAAVPSRVSINGVIYRKVFFKI